MIFIGFLSELLGLLVTLGRLIGPRLDDEAEWSDGEPSDDETEQERKERTVPPSSVGDFLCHIAIQPNGSRMMAKTASLSKVIDFGHRSWTILDMFDLDMYTIRRLSTMVCKNLTLPASLGFVLTGGLSQRTRGMGEVAEGG